MAKAGNVGPFLVALEVVGDRDAARGRLRWVSSDQGASCSVCEVAHGHWTLTTASGNSVESWRRGETVLEHFC